MLAVSAENVSKRFGKVLALDNVSLSVRQGEIFGLLGPNGAGKTTLISILCGLLSPTGGSVKILGKDVFRERLKVLEEIAVVAGNSRFHHRETPYEILRFHAKVREVPNWEERVEELIRVFEMEDFRDRTFRDMSTGQRVRMMLGKAMVGRPRFIMLDEPTLGLDPDISVRVRKFIRKLPKSGTTVLLTSHYMQEVEELCDRVAFINKGKIIDVGSVAKVKGKVDGRIGLVIVVRKIVDRQVLKRLGLKAKGNVLRGVVDADSQAFRILANLEEAGFDIRSFDKKSPTLEDYFVRMTGEGGR